MKEVPYKILADDGWTARWLVCGEYRVRFPAAFLTG